MKHSILDIDLPNESICLVGYYGGLNYGDELILETLLTILHKRDAKNISILYGNIQTYDSYHEDYGYQVVERIPLNVIKDFSKRKNIIVGGGGHWGMDANANILALSVLLFFFWLLRKNVVLLGVGFYSSTNRRGRLAARFAGQAASRIYARDKETYENFSKYSHNVVMSEDIAECLSSLKLSKVETIESLDTLAQNSSVTVTSLRRFTSNPEVQKKYEEALRQYVSSKKRKNVVCILLMEPERVDPDGHTFAQSLSKKYKDVHVVSFNYNPLQLYATLKKHNKKIFVAGLQYHLLLIAITAGIENIWPIAYDNKCEQILKKYKFKTKNIEKISASDFENK